MTKFNSTHLRLTVWLAVLLVIVAGSMQMSQTVQGQDADNGGAATAPAADAEAGDEEDEDSVVSSLGDQLFKTPESVAEWIGIAFYLTLLVFSLFAATVIFERLVNLNRDRVMPASFCRRLKSALNRGPAALKDFRSLCDSSATPVSKILRAGVLRAGRSLPEVEKSMEDAAAREMAELRGKHRALSVIGSVAPLIGLLGTVVGMIFAFGAASVAGLGSGQGLLQGLFVALWTTAGGLTIAIPCLLFAAWFNTKVDRFFRDMDELLLETMPSFALLENVATELTAAGSELQAAVDQTDEEGIEIDDESDAEIVIHAR